MEIRDNLLLLNKESEFSNRTLRYFFNRLRLFLLVDYTLPQPFVCFTHSYTAMDKFYDGEGGESKDCSAFYDEATKTIVFNANVYNIKSSHYGYIDKDFYEKEKDSGYKYVIPLSDIYHELTHHVQYSYANYSFTDLVEGSAELFSYMLTGQDCILYTDECLAMWYFARKVLKLDLLGFYTLIAKIITNPNFPTKYLFFNKAFLKILNKKYKNNFKSYMNSIKKTYAPLADKQAMFKDLDKLHNLIFYRY